MGEDLREKEIISLLHEQGYISLHALMEAVHASESTVRRLVIRMEQRGVLRRTYGGIAALNGNAYAPLTVRNEIDVSNKKINARNAYQMIREGDCVFFDCSSSSYYISECLRQKKHFTAVTNGLPMCEKLLENGVNTYFIGGHMDCDDYAGRGSIAIESLKIFHFNLAFFSCRSISDDGSLGGYSEEGINFLKAVLQCTEKRVFLFNPSQLNTSRLLNLCSIMDIDAVPTPDLLPPHLLDMLGKNRPSFKTVPSGSTLSEGGKHFEA